MKILKLFSMCFIGLTAGCQSARPVTWPAPRYPDMLRCCIQGMVVAHIPVSADGTRGPIRFDKTPTYHELFAHAIRNAFSAVTFIPARRFGRSVNGEITAPMRFVLLRSTEPRPAGVPETWIDSLPKHCPAAPAPPELVICAVFRPNLPIRK